MEERHVELAPEGEREKIRQIFHAKGFRGDALDSVVDVITAKRHRWIETMMGPRSMAYRRSAALQPRRRR